MSRMKTEVIAWLAFAKQTQGIMEQAISGFQVLSDTYQPMRDIGFEDEEKEAIDQHYSELNEVRAELAGLQAGGAKRRKRTKTHRRKNKSRKH